MIPRRGRRTTTGVLFTASCALVIGLPLGARLVDTEADDPSRFSIALWIGWAVCGILGAIVLLHLIARVVPAPSAVLAVAFDALPILLTAGWALLVPALVTEHWLLATVAGALCAYQIWLVAPRWRRARPPAWTRDAPTFRVCVANVYIDNPTPREAAAALVDVGADVLVIVESTPTFLHELDQAGGTAAYPHRVDDPDDSSDYAVTVLTQRPVGEGSGPEHRGPLTAIRVEVPVGEVIVTLVALNPMATVDPGGYSTWRAQVRQLRRMLAGTRGPLVVAGDLNTSRFRPEFGGLLSLGLRDVHDTVGKGLRPSFKLSNDGVLAKLGPVARLDHALTNRQLFPVEVEDLEAHGSDHLPFVVTLAVRASRRAHARRARRAPDRPTTTPAAA